MNSNKTAYDFEATALDGSKITFDRYKGKVLLVVNVASKCGFTPQYEGLEALHKKYQAQGLVVMGFPCNQFGAQEPGDAAEIQKFCSLTYEVSFQMFEKVDVNGSNTHPFYEFLKAEKRGLLGTEGIKWNFTKFLVDRTGTVVKRYAPQDSPVSIATDIERALKSS